MCHGIKGKSLSEININPEEVQFDEESVNEDDLPPVTSKEHIIYKSYQHFFF